MSGIQIKNTLSFLTKELQLRHYTIRIEEISDEQVCDEHCRSGNQLIGIHADHTNCKACVYHTKKLTQRELITQLIQLKFPHLTEDQIAYETQRWLDYCKRKHLGRTCDE